MLRSQAGLLCILQSIQKPDCSETLVFEKKSCSKENSWDFSYLIHLLTKSYIFWLFKSTISIYKSISLGFQPGKRENSQNAPMTQKHQAIMKKKSDKFFFYLLC